MADALGTFTDYQSFIALLRARKEQLSLSDLALDDFAGLAPGHTGKVLGPSQVKGMGVLSFTLLLDALGLSGTLHVDPAKAARLSGRWAGAASRRSFVRPNGPMSVKRARPIVLSAAARKAAKARWAKAPPELRAATVAALNAARAAKRLRAGTSNAA